jgi:hypothetical protein
MTGVRCCFVSSAANKNQESKVRFLHQRESLFVFHLMDETVGLFL